ncbi:MAG: aspartate-semialdehyde dehydrogenase, partial [Bacteroidota bacterium]|nr:aspartate-semialdehyde dehydrogenase [Bacteroidota bacterium]
PNCSTIQLLLALAPLHKKYKIKRLIISTYQSITGSGIKAVNQLENERNNIPGEKAYPHKIDKNCLPHCDDFLENNYTKEEMKLVNETHKILDKNIKTTATAVRVPVSGGHSESVNIEFDNKIDISEIKTILANSPGIIVQDNPTENIYPMPINSEGKNEVFVGRIRRDESIENGLNMFIVADNLRKGAATNAIQIAQYLINKNLV